jgi:antitoxin VapB
VRLPNAYRFSGTEVIVKHFGHGVLLPIEDAWQTLEAGLAAYETGFQLSREQPERQLLHPHHQRQPAAVLQRFRHYRMGEIGVQEAKARLSQLVKRNQQQPQQLTSYGEPVAVVLSAEAYLRHQYEGEALVAFIRRSPLVGAEELDLERKPDVTQDLDRGDQSDPGS